MNTADAARKAGVTSQQLLQWQREGWLTPASNGRTDTNRRLDWSDKDVDQAKELKHQDSHKSASEALIDSLGGREFTEAVGRARALQDKLTRGEVVVAGPRGARIVGRRTLIEAALSVTGTPAVLLAFDSPA